MSLTTSVAGKYLIIGCHNTNTSGLYSLDLYIGNDKVCGTALSEAGQYNWRMGTIAYVADIAANVQVQMRKDGACVTAAADGRSELVLLRIG